MHNMNEPCLNLTQETQENRNHKKGAKVRNCASSSVFYVVPHGDYYMNSPATGAVFTTRGVLHAGTKIVLLPRDYVLLYITPPPQP